MTREKEMMVRVADCVFVNSVLSVIGIFRFCSKLISLFRLYC